MKLVVLSDTHGRQDWKIVTSINQDADLFIFLGDYFDSLDIHTDVQLTNFKEIISFKEQNPGKVILLTGNHDTHYLPYFIDRGQHYSGFQDSRLYDISLLLQANLSHLQMAYQYNDFVFTHAGVTNTWLNNNAFTKTDNLIDFINNLFVYRPAAFATAGYDPSGESRHSSPVWVRPRSLMSNAYRYDKLKQVVGHTQHKRVTVIKGRYFFTDAPGSREYLSIVNDEATICKMPE